MHWMRMLYQTYDNCHSIVGKPAGDSGLVLCPIYHLTRKSHIEVVVSMDGKFIRASGVPETDPEIIIPCTEESSTRTSACHPHPLCDKIAYVGGYYSQKTEPYYTAYLNQLKQWVDAGAPSLVGAIYTYVARKCLIEDLKRVNIITEKGTLNIPNETVKNVTDALVRWVVEHDGKRMEVWSDTSLYRQWADYYTNECLKSKSHGFCVVTGKHNVALTQFHPKQIRNNGDNAKIICQAEESTALSGMLNNLNQISPISVEATQKAHAALKWLIRRQGYIKDTFVVVAWAPSGKRVLMPCEGILFADESTDTSVDTGQDVGLAIRKRLAGHYAEITDRDDVCILALDSLTPGRLSVVFYQQLSGSDFLKKIESWYTKYAWDQLYWDKTAKQWKTVIGVPSFNDIVKTAYGHHQTQQNPTLFACAVRRLLHCMLYNEPIPNDMVTQVVQRASHRESMDPIQWEQTLRVACALAPKKYTGGMAMELDTTNTSRDYLYGRLLAIADVFEERILKRDGKSRPTTAAKYMHQFSYKPYTTWSNIHNALSVHFNNYPTEGVQCKNEISEVMKLFSSDQYTNNTPLSAEYLLGYYHQRQLSKTTSGGYTNEEK